MFTFKMYIKNVLKGLKSNGNKTEKIKKYSNIK